MQILSPITKYFSNILGRYSLDDIIAADIEKTTKEYEQCKQVIKSHSLLEHLAKRRLDALVEWTRREAIRESITPLPTLNKELPQCEKVI